MSAKTKKKSADLFETLLAAYPITRKDILAPGLFVIFWLLPMVYVGLTNKDVPLMPRTLSYMQRISYLFTHTIESWPIYYIQGIPAGSENWITLEESDYFRLLPFGYRTRLHQVLYNTKDTGGYQAGLKKARNREQEIAYWIAKRYRQIYSDRPPLKSVRFLAGFYVVQERPAYHGHWRKPPLASLPADRITVMSTHNIYEK